jgi:ATP-dependent DNA helicase PIF1
MKRTHSTLVRESQELQEQEPGLRLTSEQSQAVAAITRLSDPQCLFLTGEAGAGKSVVAQEAIKRILANGAIRFIVAGSTGIAALEIGGATLAKHMGWKINGDTVDMEWLAGHAEAVASSTRFPKKPRPGEPKPPNYWWIKDALCNAKGMLIDEVSMLSARTTDNLDFCLRRIRGFPTKPFGGLKIIFVGDFFQLPPVLKDKGLYNPDYHFAFQARAWKEAKVRMVYLPGSQRQKGDQGYAALLSRARLGRLTKEDEAALQARVLPPPTGDDAFVSYLFPHNREADAKNAECLVGLPTPLRTFTAVDTFNRPFLTDDVFKDMRAIKTISLKEGAHVMLLINMGRQELATVSVPLPEDEAMDEPEHWALMSSAERAKQKEVILANGSVGRVVRFARIPGEAEECPIVRFARKHGKGVLEVPIRTHNFEIRGTNPRDDPIATRIQLPLLLCYAISSHKSQGQTIEAPIVPDLVRSFEDGMAYVMLSRVKALDQLHLPNFDPKVFKAPPKVLEYYMQEGFVAPLDTE